MTKYSINGSTLTRLADALREVTGSNRTYTPEEMIQTVTTILDSSVYILVDENGNEVVATYIDSDAKLTAGPNDIRIGTTAVTEEGLVEGKKEIPAYITTEGFEKIPAGSSVCIHMFSDLCEYTKLQAIVCAYNTSALDSVAAEKVSIDGNVYSVNSTTIISEVSVDSETQTIKLNITNDSEKPVVVRYFTYKEEY